jgi:hypothetical protein
MASLEPDLFARLVSGLALAISALTLLWTRVDKHREREAAKLAGLPSAKMRFDPAMDDDGWYTLKFTFRDLNQGVRFDRARVIRPRRSAIATWNGGFRGPGGVAIPLNWEFTAGPNPVYGDASAVAHLHLRTTGNPGAEIRIQLEGRFLNWAMTPFEMTVVSQPA